MVPAQEIISEFKNAIVFVGQDDGNRLRSEATALLPFNYDLINWVIIAFGLRATPGSAQG